MKCWSVKRRSTEYVVGRLRPSEHSRIQTHLVECEKCSFQIDEMRTIRSSLSRLPAPQIPESLRTRLRVTASRERQILLETQWSRLQRVWNRWRMRMDELMRPLTLPA